MHYPKTESLFAVDDQYLVGSDLLVKPVTAPGVVETSVKFPSDHSWYDAESLKVVSNSSHAGSYNEVIVPSGIDTIPVFQRGGSVIARKLRLRRSTHMMIKDPYTLYIALDSSMKAVGTLYMDDEETFNHERNAEYGLASFTADFSSKTGIISNIVELGAGWTGNIDTVPHSFTIERVIIMGIQKAPSSVDVGPNTLGFTYNSQAKVLVIRRPTISALANWEMVVKP
jgi:mannosyl-oligosaccharide alpha-1,3-glucosidase